MARFDVYANPDMDDRAVVPYLLDVQSDYLKGLETRVVIPLFAAARFSTTVRTLNPELKVDGKSVVMDTASIGAVPAGELRRPVVNVSGRQLDIQDALDALFAGY
ncbi:CcdB family protein [Variovorax sp. RHLX14]|uniref:CcdB family protein n=1 Tax=Variovorax sp. RHLX14 TaxID=1259731 RepID=UPI003F44A97A